MPVKLNLNFYIIFKLLFLFFIKKFHTYIKYIAKITNIFK